MPPYNDNGSEMNQLNSSMENESNSTYLMAKRDPLYIVVPMTIMYSVIFVTGVIGNSITCMVIAKHKYMHTATNYYLFSLAVSDLILLVSGLPQEMWSIWSKYPYVFGEIFCQLRGVFSEMSANATVLTITAFTAERYVAICHPFMAQSMSKLSRAVKLIVVIWIVAVLFAIPQALQFTLSPLDTPSRDMTCNIISVKLMDTDIELSTVSFTLSTVLFFVLPMTFITVLYALIGLRLRRSDKLKRTITVRSSKGEKKISSPEYRANSSSKVLKMLVAVVVAFFICWAPFHVQRLFAIFGSSTFGPDTPLLHQLYNIATYVSGVLYYVSTTINPILYHIMSLKFRSAFKETMLRCCGGNGGGGGGDGRSGGGERRSSGRRNRRRSGRRHRRRGLRDGPLSAAVASGGRYRRVSGWWTSSSVRLSGGGHGVGHGVVDDAATVWRRLAAVCWRRRQRRRRPSDADGNGTRRHDSRDGEDDSNDSNDSNGSSGGSSSSSSSNSSTGDGGGLGSGADGGGGGAENGHGRGPIASPSSSSKASKASKAWKAPKASAGRAFGQRPSVAPMALSNWTVISNSSLKDVDGDDLRDELVGYAAAAAAADRATCCCADTMMTTTTTTTTVNNGGPVEIFVAEEYYY